jgi:hypothetical protein
MVHRDSVGSCFVGVISLQKIRSCLVSLRKELAVMATNFEEYVLKMAEGSPHSVVLDWYRRIASHLTTQSHLRAKRFL